MRCPQLGISSTSSLASSVGMWYLFEGSGRITLSFCLGIFFLGDGGSGDDTSSSSVVSSENTQLYLLPMVEQLGAAFVFDSSAGGFASMVDWDGSGTVEVEADGDADASASFTELEDAAIRARRRVRRRVSYLCAGVALVPAQ
jgi:hypothetical protein